MFNNALSTRMYVRCQHGPPIGGRNRLQAAATNMYMEPLAAFHGIAAWFALRISQAAAFSRQLLLHWQVSYSFPCGCEDRIAYSRSHRRHARLADTRRRSVARHDVHLCLNRGFIHPSDL